MLKGIIMIFVVIIILFAGYTIIKGFVGSDLGKSTDALGDSLGGLKDIAPTSNSYSIAPPEIRELEFDET